MSFLLQESIKYVEEEMKEMDEKGRVDVPPRTSKDGQSVKGLCCRFFSEFIDWRYSQLCWYFFGPAL